MPFYKHECYIHDAVQSILNQDSDQWKLIIINDDPKVSLEAYKLLDNRITVLQDGKHKGQCARLNEGIAIVDTKYVTFQDADDTCPPFRIRMMLDIMKDSDIGCSDAIKIYPNGKRVYFRKQPTEKLKDQPICCFTTIFIKREIAIQAPFRIDETYGNDWLWFIRVSKKINKGAYLPLSTMNVNCGTSTYYNFYLNKRIKKIIMNRKMKALKNKVALELAR
jgi:glycosyltransferase involved in cell wall biosynthesis